MLKQGFVVAAAMTAALSLVGCGGSDVKASINMDVAVSWEVNREAAVNRLGGGYRVYHSPFPGFSIANASFVDVPYVSGSAAPTNTQLTLVSGTHYIRIVAYSALNPDGGEPSAQISVNVPFDTEADSG